jgi:hypothetical protein
MALDDRGEGRAVVIAVECCRRQRRLEPELEYPLHDRIVTVTSCGRLCIGRRKIT